MSVELKNVIPIDPERPPVADGGRLRPLVEAAERMGQGARQVRVRYGLASALRVSDRLVDRCISSYERAFRLEGDERLDIYLQISADFAREGRFTEAMSAVTEVLAVDPTHAGAWFQAGILYLRQGQAAEAGEAFGKAKALGDDSFELNYRLAEAYAELDRHDDAVKELRAAVDKVPDAAEAYYRLGVSLDRLARYEDAVVAFEQAIKLSPRETSYHQSLGFTFDSMGRREDAIRCFKRAVQLERRTQS